MKIGVNMLSIIEKQTLRKKLAEYEGNISHMYLDSKGYVTVGVGHLLRTLQDAQKLPFMNNKNIRATVAEIKSDYDNVKKQPKNRLASFYKKFTKLKLSDVETDKLTNLHIDSFYKELKIIYPGFDKYPSEAKLALCDMIFNLGMTNLKTQWPTMNAAVKSKDWKKAAANSNRKPPISMARNKYVKELFEKAANKIK